MSSRQTGSSARGLAARRLLITEDAPAYGVLAAVRALRAAGYEIWVATTGSRSYTARSRVVAGTVRVRSPAADAPAYVADLAEHSARLGIDAVLPGTEVALVTLAGKEEQFPSGMAIGTCPPEVVRRAVDKRELGALVRAAGLKAPPTRLITREEMETGLDFESPVVLKTPSAGIPATGRTARAGPTRRVGNHAELRRIVDAHHGHQWLVQPYLASQLSAVCGVAWRGRLVCAEHQVACRIYPPDCGISAYAMTVPLPLELRDGVKRLVEVLGWSGIFQVQFLGGDGQRYVIDLNPRVYGSLALAVAAGMNLPAVWADLLLGGRSRPVGYSIGVRFRSEERDAGALTAALMRREWRTVFRGMRPRSGTAHALFSLRDPLPVLTMLRQLRWAPGLIARRHRA